MNKVFISFRYNFFYFFICSFIGWLCEVMWFLIFTKEFVNRGFFFGPYLPIYGFGILAIIYLLRNLKRKKIKFLNINITPIIVCIAIFFVTSIVEYIGHYILDEFFSIELWDYSNKFLNINGRICLEASLIFAVGGLIYLYCIYPLLEKLYKSLSNNIKNFIFAATFIIMIIDILVKIL